MLLVVPGTWNADGSVRNPALAVAGVREHEEAVRQARQAIRKARRERPTARIVVTGCAAQTDPEAFAAMPEVDLILGNREKLTAASYAFGAADGAGGFPPGRT